MLKSLEKSKFSISLSLRGRFLAEAIPKLLINLKASLIENLRDCFASLRSARNDIKYCRQGLQIAATRIWSVIILITFISSSVVPPRFVYAQSILSLPAPGTMIALSPKFTPILVRGITIDPKNSLKLSFIVDSGNEKLSDNEFKTEADRLIKYFFACLTVPEKDMWVNLSPMEKGRIIPNEFGITEAGRDLLAQDYILKQLTASLIYPEDDLGKKFWDRIYKEAYKQYGTTNIPVNTFNKVWIIPDKALVVESGNTAFLAQSHLKVMLEEDYMGLNQNLNNKDIGTDTLNKEDVEKVSNVSSKIIKELILPAIEKEVNEGKNFSNLRQIAQSMILATWYKKNLKESLLGKVYIDQNKVKGIDLEDKTQKEQIYQQYLQAIQKGVYNYIKEDFDPNTQETLQRKYFAGGFTAGEMSAALTTMTAQRAFDAGIAVNAEAVGKEGLLSVTTLSYEFPTDAAMSAIKDEGRKIQDQVAMPADAATVGENEMLTRRDFLKMAGVAGATFLGGYLGLWYFLDDSGAANKLKQNAEELKPIYDRFVIFAKGDHDVASQLILAYAKSKTKDETTIKSVFPWLSEKFGVKAALNLILAHAESGFDNIWESIPKYMDLFHTGDTDIDSKLVLAYVKDGIRNADDINKAYKALMDPELVLAYVESGKNDGNFKRIIDISEDVASGLKQLQFYSLNHVKIDVDNPDLINKLTRVYVKFEKTKPTFGNVGNPRTDTVTAFKSFFNFFTIKAGVASDLSARLTDIQSESGLGISLLQGVYNIFDVDIIMPPSSKVTMVEATVALGGIDSAMAGKTNDLAMLSLTEAKQQTEQFVDGPNGYRLITKVGEDRLNKAKKVIAELLQELFGKPLDYPIFDTTFTKGDITADQEVNVAALEDKVGGPVQISTLVQVVYLRTIGMTDRPKLEGSDLVMLSTDSATAVDVKDEIAKTNQILSGTFSISLLLDKQLLQRLEKAGTLGELKIVLGELVNAVSEMKTSVQQMPGAKRDVALFQIQRLPQLKSILEKLDEQIAGIAVRENAAKPNDSATVTLTNGNAVDEDTYLQLFYLSNSIDRERNRAFEAIAKMATDPNFSIIRNGKEERILRDARFFDGDTLSQERLQTVRLAVDATGATIRLIDYQRKDDGKILTQDDINTRVKIARELIHRKDIGTINVAQRHLSELAQQIKAGSIESNVNGPTNLTAIEQELKNIRILRSTGVDIDVYNYNPHRGDNDTIFFTGIQGVFDDNDRLVRINNKPVQQWEDEIKKDLVKSAPDLFRKGFISYPLDPLQEAVLSLLHRYNIVSEDVLNWMADIIAETLHVSDLDVGIALERAEARFKRSSRMDMGENQLTRPDIRLEDVGEVYLPGEEARKTNPNLPSTVTIPLVGKVEIIAGQKTYSITFENNSLNLVVDNRVEGRFPLSTSSEEHRIQVGRSGDPKTDNNISFPDNSLLSRVHFYFEGREEKPGEYVIKVGDLKSTNGTRIQFKSVAVYADAATATKADRAEVDKILQVYINQFIAETATGIIKPDDKNALAQIKGFIENFDEQLTEQNLNQLPSIAGALVTDLNNVLANEYDVKLRSTPASHALEGTIAQINKVLTKFALEVPTRIDSAVTVLIVDPDDVMIPQLGYQLKGRGYFVRRAKSGKEALESIINYGFPDMILMGDEFDTYNVNDMGPRELAKVLKKEYPTIPTILMTKEKVDSNATDALKNEDGYYEVVGKKRLAVDFIQDLVKVTEPLVVKKRAKELGIDAAVAVEILPVMKLGKAVDMTQYVGEEDSGKIINPRSKALISLLNKNYGERLKEAKKKRELRLAKMERGELSLGFRPETDIIKDAYGEEKQVKAIREEVWTVDSVPDRLDKPGVILTGPWSPAMAISSLSGKAIEGKDRQLYNEVLDELINGNELSDDDKEVLRQVKADLEKVQKVVPTRIFADFEDAKVVNGDGAFEGLQTFRDIMTGKLRSFVSDAKKKTYAVPPRNEWPTVTIRLPGLHLLDRHMKQEGKEIPEIFTHMAMALDAYREALQNYPNLGIDIVIPKLESPEELVLVIETMEGAKKELGIKNSFNIILMNETIEAALQLEEMIYAGRHHVKLSNVGRWDKGATDVRSLWFAQHQVYPDFSDVGMRSLVLDSYVRRNVAISKKRGVKPEGGMVTALPSEGNKDPEADRSAIRSIVLDKLYEWNLGYDYGWAASPSYVPLVQSIFQQRRTKAIISEPVRYDQNALDELTKAPEGKITEKGIYQNAYDLITYILGYRNSGGAVAIDNLANGGRTMYDLATAKKSQYNLWTYVQAKPKLTGTQTVADQEYIKKIFDQVFTKTNDRYKQFFSGDEIRIAREIATRLITNPKMVLHESVFMNDSIDDRDPKIVISKLDRWLTHYNETAFIPTIPEGFLKEQMVTLKRTTNLDEKGLQAAEGLLKELRGKSGRYFIKGGQGNMYVKGQMTAKTELDVPSMSPEQREVFLNIVKFRASGQAPTDSAISVEPLQKDVDGILNRLKSIDSSFVQAFERLRTSAQMDTPEKIYTHIIPLIQEFESRGNRVGEDSTIKAPYLNAAEQLKQVEGRINPSPTLDAATTTTRRDFLKTGLKGLAAVGAGALLIDKIPDLWNASQESEQAKQKAIEEFLLTKFGKKVSTMLEGYKKIQKNTPKSDTSDTGRAFMVLAAARSEDNFESSIDQFIKAYPSVAKIPDSIISEDGRGVLFVAAVDLTAKDGTFEQNLENVMKEYAAVEDKTFKSKTSDTGRAFLVLAATNTIDAGIATIPTPGSPEYGGIDLNAANLDLQIKRDGNGIPLPMNLQPIESMHIEGFIPVIINITPIESLPLLLGVKDIPAPSKNTLGLNSDHSSSPVAVQELSYAINREEEMEMVSR